MNLLYLAQGSFDLFGRLQTLFESAGTLGIAAVITAAVGGFYFATTADRRWLILAYCVCLMFSGHLIQAIDSGATLLRWMLILCLALSVNRGFRNAGVMSIMLGAYWCVALLSVAWSKNPMLGLQLSVLSVMLTIPMAMTISDELADRNELDSFPRYMNWCSLIYIFNSLLLLSELRGARFSGSTTSAPLFVITGGILMPCLLWGVLRSRNIVLRNLHIVAFATVFFLGLLSGQRTGFFAGVLGCTPLLLRFFSERVGYFVLAMLAIVLSGIVVIQFFPEQAEFIQQRYFEKGLNAREDRWSRGMEAIAENPILGHGAGSHTKVGFGMHNAFMQEWYNGGVLGVVLFFGSFVYGLYKSVEFSLDRSLPPEPVNLARLCLGLLIVVVSTAFFESKLSSPSNILSFTAINVGIILHHLEVRRTLVRSGSHMWT